jgi:hypothetical protein
MDLEGGEAMSIDVIIRTHDPARLDELGRAVFSAAMQDYRPVTILVVCQRFGAADVAAVHAALGPIMEVAGGDATLVVLNRPDAEPVDARAALLNMGLRAGTSRYVAFLDYDDLIYAEGWRVLIAELANSGAAVAFGAVLNASVSRDGLVPYVAAKRRVFVGNGLPQLLRSNFCPIHSFVLDRSRIDPQDLAVDESLVALEDYELLLRLVSHQPSSFHLKDTIVGEYLLKDDHSNLNPMAELGSAPGGGSGPWAAAVAEIERWKAGMVIGPAVQAQLQVHEPGLTVAEYLARTDALS